MSSTQPLAAPEDRTVYPVEERVGEDIVQRLIVELLRPLIERWLEAQGTPSFVGADQFIYYGQYNAHKRIAPDVYVMPGVAPHAKARSWKLWELGKAPSLAIEVVSQDWEKDYYEAPDKYAELGAEELVIFDPDWEQRPRGALFQRFARQHGKWQLVEQTNRDRVRSEVLGAWLRSVSSKHQLVLRVATDPSGDDLFPTAEEAALARVHALEEELKRRG